MRGVHSCGSPLGLEEPDIPAQIKKTKKRAVTLEPEPNHLLTNHLNEIYVAQQHNIKTTCHLHLKVILNPIENNHWPEGHDGIACREGPDGRESHVCDCGHDVIDGLENHKGNMAMRRLMVMRAMRPMNALNAVKAMRAWSACGDLDNINRNADMNSLTLFP